MKTLTAKQLKEMQDRNEDFTLVNTLDEEHFDQTRIPGSANIPRKSDDFVSQVESKAGGKDAKVVVYCASEECDSSPKAGKQLEEAGFTNVADFDAGAKGWQEAGYELEKATVSA